MEMERKIMDNTEKCKVITIKTVIKERTGLDNKYRENRDGKRTSRISHFVFGLKLITKRMEHKIQSTQYVYILICLYTSAVQ